MSSVPAPEERPRTFAAARRTAQELLAADFTRSLYPFGRITLTIWRHGQALRYTKGPVCFIARRLVLIADLVWTQGLMGAELPHEVWVGPGLKLEHGGRGVIMHPSVSIGSGATIYHQVTIGVRDGRGAATVGDRVFIGAGARLLGPIRVGDGARIGANAVLLSDADSDQSYVGVPARPVGAPRVQPH